MNDHIPDATKMIQDTPRMQSALLDHPDAGFAKIWQVGCDIERELTDAQDRIRLLVAERNTARLQSDQRVSLREEFRELLGTDEIEQGVVVVRGLQERIKRLEEMYEGKIGENEHFIGSNLQGLLTRELNTAQDCIKRLEDIISRAAYAFFRDGSDGKAANAMLTILEEVRKP